MRSFFLSIVFGTVFLVSNAQTHELGIFLGGSYYIGDLNRKHFPELTKPLGGLIYRYNPNDRLALRGNALLAWIQGDDARSNSLYFRQRNLHFRSKVYELSAVGEFNFVDYAIGSDKDMFSPYVFLGLAFFHFNPQAALNEEWYALRPLGTEGQGISKDFKKYKLNQLSLPFGAGIKVNLSKFMGLAIEWGPRKTFTDYLDDVSRTYTDPIELLERNGPLALGFSDRSLDSGGPFSNVGRQRGNPRNKDWYIFTGFIITFLLPGGTSSCDAYH